MNDIGAWNHPGLVLIIIFTLCFWLYRQLLPKPIPGIPYNKRSAKRILGDIPDAGKWVADTGETWSFVTKRVQELNSPIIQLFMRGPLRKPWVVITDFRESLDIQTVRQGEFDRSAFLADVFGPLLPYNHVWMPSNERFRAHRSLLRETMAPNFLHNVAAPAIHNVTQDLLRLWREKIRLGEGRPFQADKDILRNIVDIILLASLGLRTDMTNAQADLLRYLDQIQVPVNMQSPVEFPMAAESPTYTCIRELVDSVQIGMNSPIPKQHMQFALKYYPSLAAARKFTDELMKRVLRSAWEKFNEQGRDNEITSALELVVQREVVLARKENRPVMENNNAIRDELFGFYIAGHETTSTTICWAVKRLSMHQKIQQRLRDEFRSVYPDAIREKRLPSAKEIVNSSVPYLDAFIEENHRHCTTIPAVIRRTTRDAVILGHQVPEGTDVFMMLHGPTFQSPGFPIDESRRSQTSQDSKDRYGKWPDEDISDFKPERFLVKDESGRYKFDSRAGPVLPYGAGLRGCFGIRLAVLELKIIITTLIWSFTFEETPPSLSSFQACDFNTHRAKQTYIKISNVAI